jgi:S-adenosyl-L-methionine hydrolase (adenosine-forming)
VIKRIAPDVEVIHVSHGIAPQNVLHGALVLARTLPFMPAGVHVAVVDPGVGGERKALALGARDGRLYVGPDNGLLVLAAESLGGIAEAAEIADPAFMLEPVSATFHGRDVFAPAAAHLARGVALSELGPAVPVESLRRVEPPRPRVSPSEIVATVLDIDRFGNVQLNVTMRELEDAGIGAALEVAVGDRRQAALVARTFAEVARGETVVYEDAYRSVAVAVNGASAAEALAARIGTAVALRP